MLGGMNHKLPEWEGAPEDGGRGEALTVLGTPLSRQQSPQKSLQRTLSDESLCSGRREPSFASPASPEAGLPGDVLFTSTCAFPSSTLPARRQHPHPHPPGGGPSAIPATTSSFPEKKCECGHPGAGGGVTPGSRSRAPGVQVASRSKARGHQCQSQLREGTGVHTNLGALWVGTE